LTPFFSARYAPTVAISIGQWATAWVYQGVLRMCEESHAQIILDGIFISNLFLFFIYLFSYPLHEV